MKLTTRIAYSIFPAQIWSAISAEWPMTILRLRNRWLPWRLVRAQTLRQMKGVRLHLGCGKRVIPGWTNIDCFAADGIAFECDFRDPLPFTNDSVSMLYSEHVLEHLHEEEAHGLLHECFRVLSPGGYIRLGVPDAEIFISAYCANDRSFFETARNIGSPSRPLDTPMKVINQMARMGGHHHYAWDYETLRLTLQEAGFQHIVKGSPGKSAYEGLCLDDPSHAFETLYVEGRK